MEQELLFSEEELISWKAEWHNMPEYEHEDLTAKFQILVSFACEADLIDFGRVIGRELKPTKGRQTRSIWFPPAEIGHMMNKRYVSYESEVPGIHSDEG